tara:strand:- start:364 stop:1824 length:1461 start_codon:yes stop_codon:yes gene_type:complete
MLWRSHARLNRKPGGLLIIQLFVFSDCNAGTEVEYSKELEQNPKITNVRVGSLISRHWHAEYVLIELLQNWEMRHQMFERLVSLCKQSPRCATAPRCYLVDPRLKSIFSNSIHAVRHFNALICGEPPWSPQITAFHYGEVVTVKPNDHLDKVLPNLPVDPIYITGSSGIGKSSFAEALIGKSRGDVMETDAIDFKVTDDTHYIVVGHSTSPPYKVPVGAATIELEYERRAEPCDVVAHHETILLPLSTSPYPLLNSSNSSVVHWVQWESHIYPRDFPDEYDYVERLFVLLTDKDGKKWGINFREDSGPNEYGDHIDDRVSRYTFSDWDWDQFGPNPQSHFTREEDDDDTGASDTKESHFTREEDDDDTDASDIKEECKQIKLPAGRYYYHESNSMMCGCHTIEFLYDSKMKCMVPFASWTKDGGNLHYPNGCLKDHIHMLVSEEAHIIAHNIALLEESRVLMVIDALFEKMQLPKPRQQDLLSFCV